MTRERPGRPRLRLFVALELAEEVRDRVVSWQEQEFGRRRDLRLVPRYSLHVTLVFLGYQAERDVERITELSFAEEAQPFRLTPEELVEVPPRRPRLYAIGMKDHEDALGRWQAGLAERLNEGGFYEPEKRPFWAHVTVARFKQTERHRTAGGARGSGRGGRGPADPAAALPELPEELLEPFTANRLTLYRSTLKPQGAEYEPLKRVELAAAPKPAQ